jgi:LPS export ABC transporter protein LptC
MNRPVRHDARRAFAALAMSLMASACAGSDKGPTAARLTSVDSAGQVMFGVRAVLTDKGQSKGLLRADTGYVFDDGMRIDLRRVTVTFTGPAGEALSEMTGPLAIYTLGEASLELRGGIEIKSPAGRTLKTPHLVFDVASERVTSDSSYAFTNNGRTVNAVGFVTTPELLRVLSAEEQRKADAQAAKAAAEKVAKEKAAAERAAKRAPAIKPATTPAAAPAARKAPKAAAAPPAKP